MDRVSIVSLLLVLANVIFSYKGFRDKIFFEKYKFEVDQVTTEKRYITIISSGFLHADYMHLIFNMLALTAFSDNIESMFGWSTLLLIYFSSLIGSTVFALFIHINHRDYSAVGASGAVCGIIFASIALIPNMDIGFLFLPIFIPSWLFGILYIAYSIYGIKSKNDNIGHEAHLGGALIGMFVAIILYPDALAQNYFPILLVFLPALAFIYLIVTKPHFLLIDNYFFKKQNKNYSADHRYNEMKVNRQKEIDALLDKINKKGLNSLNDKEKKVLEEFSKR